MQPLCPTIKLIKQSGGLSWHIHMMKYVHLLISIKKNYFPKLTSSPQVSVIKQRRVTALKNCASSKRKDNYE